MGVTFFVYICKFKLGIEKKRNKVIFYEFLEKNLSVLQVGNGGLELLGGFTPGNRPLSNCNTTTLDNFSGLAFFVVLAKTNPLAKCLSTIYFHQWNVSIASQSLNKLLVVVFVDVLGGFSLASSRLQKLSNITLVSHFYAVLSRRIVCVYGKLRKELLNERRIF